MPELKFATIEKFANLLTDKSWLDKKDRKVAIEDKVGRLEEESRLIERKIEEQTKLLAQKRAEQEADLEIQALKANLEAAKKRHQTDKSDENKAARQLLSDQLLKAEEPVTSIEKSLRQLEKDQQKNKKSLTILQEELKRTAPSKASQKSSTHEEATSSTQSSATELEITKRAKLTKEEAFLLLQNIHILYAKGVIPECAEELKGLLFKEFKKICGDDEVVIKAELLRHNLSQSEVATVANCHEKIKPIVIMIRSMGMDLSDDYVKKLHVWFNNSPEQMEAYLRAANYSSSEAFERSFSFELPNIDALPKDGVELKFWHKINVQLERYGLELFSDANRFSNSPKIGDEFRRLVQKYGEIDIWSPEQKQEIKKELVRMRASLRYSRLEENKELAEVFASHRISEPLFNKALDFIKERGVKASDQLPDIDFEFEVRGKKYTFQKLPAGDYRGFILGKLTACCQTLGDNSSMCVEDGMTKNSSGFYVVMDDKGKIVAQSYAWLGKGNKLVFDSFESLKHDRELFATAAAKCSQKLEEKGISLMVGTGGGTPKISGVSVRSRPKPIEKLNMYGDSENVYLIDQKILSLTDKMQIRVDPDDVVNPDDVYLRYWLDLARHAGVVFGPKSLEVGLSGVIIKEQAAGILSSDQDSLSRILSWRPEVANNEEIAKAMIAGLTDTEKKKLLQIAVRGLVTTKQSIYSGKGDKYSPQELSCEFLFRQLEPKDAIDIVRSECSNKNDETLIRLIEIGCDSKIIADYAEVSDISSQVRVGNFLRDDKITAVDMAIYRDDSASLKAMLSKLTPKMAFEVISYERSAYPMPINAAIASRRQGLEMFKIMLDALTPELAFKIVSKKEKCPQFTMISGQSSVDFSGPEFLKAIFHKLTPQRSAELILRDNGWGENLIHRALELKDPELLKTMLEKLTQEQIVGAVLKKARYRSSSNFYGEECDVKEWESSLIDLADAKNPAMLKIMFEALTPENRTRIALDKNYPQLIYNNFATLVSLLPIDLASAFCKEYSRSASATNLGVIECISRTKTLFDVVRDAAKSGKIKEKTIDVIEDTIQGGAILCATDENGKTVLHLAVEASGIETDFYTPREANKEILVKKILDAAKLKGGDNEVRKIINLKDSSGRTPLDYAAGNEELRNYLVENGAETSGVASKSKMASGGCLPIFGPSEKAKRDLQLQTGILKSTLTELKRVNEERTTQARQEEGRASDSQHQQRPAAVDNQSQGR